MNTLPAELFAMFKFLLIPSFDEARPTIKISVCKKMDQNQCAGPRPINTVMNSKKLTQYNHKIDTTEIYS